MLKDQKQEWEELKMLLEWVEERNEEERLISELQLL